MSGPEFPYVAGKTSLCLRASERLMRKKASAWENMLYCVLTVFAISTFKSRPSRKPVSPMPNRMVNGCCSGGGT